MKRWQGIHKRPEEFELDPQAMLASGLVFSSLGRFAGSNHCHDSSLYQNHGVLTSMDPATDWVWSSELNRYALDFDASDDSVASNHSVPLNITGAITIAGWIKTTSTTAYILSKSIDAGKWITSTAAKVYELCFYNNTCYWQISDGTTPSVLAGTSSVWTDGNWHHIAATWTGDASTGGQKLWCDGLAVYGRNPVINEMQAVESHLAIGGYGTYHAACQLSDLQVYARVLTDSEIQQLADPSNAMLSGLILPVTRKYWAVPSGEIEIAASAALVGTNAAAAGVASAGSAASAILVGINAEAAGDASADSSASAVLIGTNAAAEAVGLARASGISNIVGGPGVAEVTAVSVVSAEALCEENNGSIDSSALAAVGVSATTKGASGTVSAVARLGDVISPISAVLNYYHLLLSV